MADSPFRIGFINGLMSKNIIIRFAKMIILVSKNKKFTIDNG